MMTCPFPFLVSSPAHVTDPVFGFLRSLLSDGWNASTYVLNILVASSQQSIFYSSRKYILKIHHKLAVVASQRHYVDRRSMTATCAPLHQPVGRVPFFVGNRGQPPSLVLLCLSTTKFPGDPAVLASTRISTALAGLSRTAGRESHYPASL